VCLYGEPRLRACHHRLVQDCHDPVGGDGQTSLQLGGEFYLCLLFLYLIFQGGDKKNVIWRDVSGNEVKNEGRYRIEGTDLIIKKANWADMGR
jgi:hypothetical protein